MATPTPETEIWLALKARVASLVLSPVLPVEYPYEAFTKPTSGGIPTNYLSVRHLPNLTDIATIGQGGYNRHFGILQITVVAQRGKGAAIATEIAGDVAYHFRLTSPPLAMTFGSTSVYIERPPSIGQMLDDEQKIMAEIPVTIRYYADVPRS